MKLEGAALERLRVRSVSRTVSIEDVASRLDQYGPLATLVSVAEGGVPHIGTVIVEVRAEVLSVRAGSTTCANIVVHPRVSLCWLRDDADYQLIVDGIGTVGDEVGDDGLREVTIDVDRGILHRLAGRADAGPSCVPLADDALR